MAGIHRQHGLVAFPLLAGLLAAQCTSAAARAAPFGEALPGAASGAAHLMQPDLAWRLGRRMLFEEAAPLSGGQEAVYIIICVLLVLFAGMMAGLTLGLLSIDKVDLEVIKRSGNERQRWLVGQVEPVLARPHFLLATLLLCNACAMEALPIFLDRLLNPLAAILISVTAILVFGEIIPQAVCKKFGLQVGAYLAYPVRALMLLTSPITWPISKLLDHILGEESALFRRHELKALVDIHAEPEGEEMAALTIDEVQVIQGALDMATKTAAAAMTPIEKVFMLSGDAVITLDLLREVINAGHSRLPVYNGTRQNIMGLILVKELVLVDENAGVRVRDLNLREVPFIRADIPMYDALKIFRMGRSHMAILTKVTAQQLEEDQAAAAEDAAARKIPRGGSKGAGMFARLSRTSPLLDANLTRSSSKAAEAPANGEGSSHQGLLGAGGGGANGGGAPPGLTRLFVKRAGSETLAEPQMQEEVIGIMTIEDVLEELLQAEILDETDRFEDNVQTIPATRLLTVQHLPKDLRRFLSRTLVAAGTPAGLRRSSGSTAALVPAGEAAAAPLLPVTTPQGSAASQPAAPGAAPPAATMPPRAASASSLGAAATAGAIMAASALGTSNLPAMGAAAVGTTLAAGHMSAALGQHPVGSPSKPPGLPRAPSAAVELTSTIAAAGGTAGGAGRSAAIPIQRPARPLVDIPRRGGSSASLSGSATRDAELAQGGGGSAPQAGSGTLVRGASGGLSAAAAEQRAAGPSGTSAPPAGPS